MRIDTESRGLLDRLPAADRAELERRGTRRRYRAGAPLFHEGDPSDWVAVVLGGRVKVSAVAGEGKEVVLAVCSSGDVLGELSAIDGLSRSATATAVDTVEALVVPVAGFRGFLGASPTASLLLLQSIAGRLRDADRREVEYTALDSMSRVATRLVELAERFGVPDRQGGVEIRLPITQDELAGWSGCSREAVGKALQALRARGWVRTGRRSIVVVDPQGLRSRARV